MTAVKIRNVGPKSAAWLRQVGVRSHEDLARTGALEAFLKVKRAGFRPSLNLLYALAGALADCHWADLPDEQKQSLLSELAAAESVNPILTRWQKAAAASERASNAGSNEDRANDDRDDDRADDHRTDDAGADDAAAGEDDAAAQAGGDTESGDGRSRFG